MANPFDLYMNDLSKYPNASTMEAPAQGGDIMSEINKLLAQPQKKEVAKKKQPPKSEQDQPNPSAAPAKPQLGKRDGTEETEGFKSLSERTSNNASMLEPFQLERAIKQITGGQFRYRTPDVTDKLTKIVTPGVDKVENFEGMPAYLQQEEGLKHLQELAKIKNSVAPQFDLSPLVAMADRWSGGNLSKAYKRPEGPQDVADRAFDTESDIQKRRETLSAQLEDMIKTQKAGYDTEKLIEAITRGNKQETIPEHAPRAPSTAGERMDRTDSKDLAKQLSPFASIVSQFKDLDKEIGGIDNWKGQDVPGMGLTGRVPLAGLGAKGSKIKELVTGIQNDLLYMRSGAQINEQEFKRLSEAIGGGLLSTDRDRVQGLKNFKNVLGVTLKAKAAGFEPTLVDRYIARGGIGEAAINSIGRGGGNAAPSGPAVGARKTYQGKTYEFKGGANVKANWSEVK
jgi:hypothetical protein